MELVMIQQQRYGGTLFGIPAGIVRDYGFKGMFRGLMPAFIRDGIYVGGFLGVTPVLQDYLMANHNMTMTTAGVWASTAAGVFAGVMSCPFDAVKTCMQGDLSRAKYGGFVSTIGTLSKGGVRSLFGGVVWRTINITLTIIIVNEACNQIGPYIFPTKFNNKETAPPALS